MARRRTPHTLALALVAAPLLLGAAPRARLEQAVAAQRQRVATEPGSAANLNDLGNLLFELGELAEAEEVYRQAMQIGPEKPEPMFNLALLLTDDRPREARRLLKQLLEDHPDHAWARYHLGTLQHARGNRSRALRQYREAFRLDSRLTDPRFNPHVLDNSLATAAMLEAFSQTSTKVSGQRQYAEPNRVSGLLLPPLTAEPGSMDEPAMDEPESTEEPEEEEASQG